VRKDYAAYCQAHALPFARAPRLEPPVVVPGLGCSASADKREAHHLEFFVFLIT
jgi:hypothetical protein